LEGGKEIRVAIPYFPTFWFKLTLWTSWREKERKGLPGVICGRFGHSFFIMWKRGGRKRRKSKEGSNQLAGSFLFQLRKKKTKTGEKRFVHPDCNPHPQRRGTREEKAKEKRKDANSFNKERRSSHHIKGGPRLDRKDERKPSFNLHDRIRVRVRTKEKNTRVVFIPPEGPSQKKVGTKD